MRVFAGEHYRRFAFRKYLIFVANDTKHLPTFFFFISKVLNVTAKITFLLTLCVLYEGRRGLWNINLTRLKPARFIQFWAHRVIFCPKWMQNGAKGLNALLVEQLERVAAGSHVPLQCGSQIMSHMDYVVHHLMRLICLNACNHTSDFCLLFLSFLLRVWTITRNGSQITPPLPRPFFSLVLFIVRRCVCAAPFPWRHNDGPSVHPLNWTDSIKGDCLDRGWGFRAQIRPRGHLLAFIMRTHTHASAQLGWSGKQRYMCMWECLSRFTAFVYGGLSTRCDSSQRRIPVLWVFLFFFLISPCVGMIHVWFHWWISSKEIPTDDKG